MKRGDPYLFTGGMMIGSNQLHVHSLQYLNPVSRPLDQALALTDCERRQPLFEGLPAKSSRAIYQKLQVARWLATVVHSQNQGRLSDPLPPIPGLGLGPSSAQDSTKSHEDVLRTYSTQNLILIIGLSPSKGSCCTLCIARIHCL